MDSPEESWWTGRSNGPDGHHLPPPEGDVVKPQRANNTAEVFHRSRELPVSYRPLSYAAGVDPYAARMVPTTIANVECRSPLLADSDEGVHSLEASGGGIAHSHGPNNIMYPVMSHPQQHGYHPYQYSTYQHHPNSQYSQQPYYAPHLSMMQYIPNLPPVSPQHLPHHVAPSPSPLRPREGGYYSMERDVYGTRELKDSLDQISGKPLRSDLNRHVQTPPIHPGRYAPSPVGGQIGPMPSHYYPHNSGNMSMSHEIGHYGGHQLPMEHYAGHLSQYPNSYNTGFPHSQQQFHPQFQRPHISAYTNPSFDQDYSVSTGYPDLGGYLPPPSSPYMQRNYPSASHSSEPLFDEHQPPTSQHEQTLYYTAAANSSSSSSRDQHSGPCISEPPSPLPHREEEEPYHDQHQQRSSQHCPKPYYFSADVNSHNQQQQGSGYNEDESESVKTRRDARGTKHKGKRKESVLSADSLENMVGSPVSPTSTSSPLSPEYREMSSSSSAPFSPSPPPSPSQGAIPKYHELRKSTKNSSRNRTYINEIENIEGKNLDSVNLQANVYHRNNDSSNSTCSSDNIEPHSTSASSSNDSSAEIIDQQDKSEMEHDTTQESNESEYDNVPDISNKSKSLVARSAVEDVRCESPLSSIRVGDVGFLRATLDTPQTLLASTRLVQATLKPPPKPTTFFIALESKFKMPVFTECTTTPSNSQGDEETLEKTTETKETFDKSTEDDSRDFSMEQDSLMENVEPHVNDTKSKNTSDEEASLSHDNVSISPADYQESQLVLRHFVQDWDAIEQQTDDDIDEFFLVLDSDGTAAQFSFPSGASSPRSSCSETYYEDNEIEQQQNATYTLIPEEDEEEQIITPVPEIIEESLNFDDSLDQILVTNNITPVAPVRPTSIAIPRCSTPTNQTLPVTTAVSPEVPHFSTISSAIKSTFSRSSNIFSNALSPKVQSPADSTSSALTAATPPDHARSSLEEDLKRSFSDITTNSPSTKISVVVTETNKTPAASSPSEEKIKKPNPSSGKSLLQSFLGSGKSFVKPSQSRVALGNKPIVKPNQDKFTNHKIGDQNNDNGDKSISKLMLPALETSVNFIFINTDKITDNLRDTLNKKNYGTRDSKLVTCDKVDGLRKKIPLEKNNNSSHFENIQMKKDLSICVPKNTSRIPVINNESKINYSNKKNNELIFDSAENRSKVLKDFIAVHGENNINLTIFSDGCSDVTENDIVVSMERLNQVGAGNTQVQLQLKKSEKTTDSTEISTECTLSNEKKKYLDSKIKAMDNQTVTLRKNKKCIPILNRRSCDVTDFFNKSITNESNVLDTVSTVDDLNEIKVKRQSRSQSSIPTRIGTRSFSSPPSFYNNQPQNENTGTVISLPINNKTIYLNTSSKLMYNKPTSSKQQLELRDNKHVFSSATSSDDDCKVISSVLPKDILFADQSSTTTVNVVSTGSTAHTLEDYNTSSPAARGTRCPTAEDLDYKTGEDNHIIIAVASVESSDRKSHDNECDVTTINDNTSILILREDAAAFETPTHSLRSDNAHIKGSHDSRKDEIMNAATGSAITHISCANSANNTEQGQGCNSALPVTGSGIHGTRSLKHTTIIMQPTADVDNYSNDTSSRKFASSESKSAPSLNIYSKLVVAPRTRSFIPTRNSKGLPSKLKNPSVVVAQNKCIVIEDLQVPPLVVKGHRTVLPNNNHQETIHGVTVSTVAAENACDDDPTLKTNELVTNIENNNLIKISNEACVVHCIKKIDQNLSKLAVSDGNTKALNYPNQVKVQAITTINNTLIYRSLPAIAFDDGRERTMKNVSSLSRLYEMKKIPDEMLSKLLLLFSKEIHFSWSNSKLDGSPKLETKTVELLNYPRQIPTLAALAEKVNSSVPCDTQYEALNNLISNTPSTKDSRQSNVTLLIETNIGELDNTKIISDGFPNTANICLSENGNDNTYYSSNSVSNSSVSNSSSCSDGDVKISTARHCNMADPASRLPERLLNGARSRSCDSQYDTNSGSTDTRDSGNNNNCDSDIGSDGDSYKCLEINSECMKSEISTSKKIFNCGSNNHTNDDLALARGENFAEFECDSIDSVDGNNIFVCQRSNFNYSDVELSEDTLSDFSDEEIIISDCDDDDEQCEVSQPLFIPSMSRISYQNVLSKCASSDKLESSSRGSTAEEEEVQPVLPSADVSGSLETLQVSHALLISSSTASAVVAEAMEGLPYLKHEDLDRLATMIANRLLNNTPGNTIAGDASVITSHNNDTDSINFGASIMKGGDYDASVSNADGVVSHNSVGDSVLSNISEDFSGVTSGYSITSSDSGVSVGSGASSITASICGSITASNCASIIANVNEDLDSKSSCNSFEVINANIYEDSNDPKKNEKSTITNVHTAKICRNIIDLPAANSNLLSGTDNNSNDNIQSAMTLPSLEGCTNEVNSDTSQADVGHLMEVGSSAIFSKFNSCGETNVELNIPPHKSTINDLHGKYNYHVTRSGSEHSEKNAQVNYNNNNCDFNSDCTVDSLTHNSDRIIENKNFLKEEKDQEIFDITHEQQSSEKVSETQLNLVKTEQYSRASGNGGTCLLGGMPLNAQHMRTNREGQSNSDTRANHAGSGRQSESDDNSTMPLADSDNNYGNGDDSAQLQRQPASNPLPHDQRSLRSSNCSAMKTNTEHTRCNVCVDCCGNGNVGVHFSLCDIREENNVRKNIIDCSMHEIDILSAQLELNPLQYSSPISLTELAALAHKMHLLQLCNSRNYDASSSVAANDIRQPRNLDTKQILTDPSAASVKTLTTVENLEGEFTDNSSSSNHNVQEHNVIPNMTFSTGVTLNMTSSSGVTPNMTSSSGVTPNMTSPIGVTPNRTSSSGITPNMTSSNGVTPNMTSSSDVTPNMTSSSGVTPGMTSSSGVAPNITSSSGVTPYITSSSGVTPNMTSPSGVAPNITSSSGVIPNITSSSGIANNITSSGSVTHTLTSSGGVTHNLTSSGSVTPNMTSSGDVTSIITSSSAVKPNTTMPAMLRELAHQAYNKQQSEGIKINSLESGSTSSHLVTRDLHKSVLVNQSIRRLECPSNEDAFETNIFNSKLDTLDANAKSSLAVTSRSLGNYQQTNNTERKYELNFPNMKVSPDPANNDILNHKNAINFNSSVTNISTVNFSEDSAGSTTRMALTCVSANSLESIAAAVNITSKIKIPMGNIESLEKGCEELIEFPKTKQIPELVHRSNGSHRCNTSHAKPQVCIDLTCVPLPATNCSLIRGSFHEKLDSAYSTSNEHDVTYELPNKYVQQSKSYSADDCVEIHKNILTNFSGKGKKYSTDDSFSTSVNKMHEDILNTKTTSTENLLKTHDKHKYIKNFCFSTNTAHENYPNQINDYELMRLKAQNIRNHIVSIVERSREELDKSDESFEETHWDIDGNVKKKNLHTIENPNRKLSDSSGVSSMSDSSCPKTSTGSSPTTPVDDWKWFPVRKFSHGETPVRKLSESSSGCCSLYEAQDNRRISVCSGHSNLSKIKEESTNHDNRATSSEEEVSQLRDKSDSPDGSLPFPPPPVWPSFTDQKPPKPPRRSTLGILYDTSTVRFNELDVRNCNSLALEKKTMNKRDRRRTLHTFKNIFDEWHKRKEEPDASGSLELIPAGDEKLIKNERSSDVLPDAKLSKEYFEVEKADDDEAASITGAFDSAESINIPELSNVLKNTETEYFERHDSDSNDSDETGEMYSFSMSEKSHRLQMNKDERLKNKRKQKSDLHNKIGSKRDKRNIAPIHAVEQEFDIHSKMRDARSLPNLSDVGEANVLDLDEPVVPHRRRRNKQSIPAVSQHHAASCELLTEADTQTYIPRSEMNISELASTDAYRSRRVTHAQSDDALLEKGYAAYSGSEHECDMEDINMDFFVPKNKFRVSLPRRQVSKQSKRSIRFHQIKRKFSFNSIDKSKELKDSISTSLQRFKSAKHKFEKLVSKSLKKDSFPVPALVKPSQITTVPRIASRQDNLIPSSETSSTCQFQSSASYSSSTSSSKNSSRTSEVWNVTKSYTKGSVAHQVTSNVPDFDGSESSYCWDDADSDFEYYKMGPNGPSPDISKFHLSRSSQVDGFKRATSHATDPRPFLDCGKVSKPVNKTAPVAPVRSFSRDYLDETGRTSASVLAGMSSPGEYNLHYFM